MTILCIMGKSGSGKSTVSNIIESAGYDRIVSYTTRQKRTGETNHIDYHFVTKEQFNKLISDGMLVEYATYNGNMYGSPKPIGSDRYVIVVETDGFKKFKQLYGSQVVGVYLDTAPEIIAERLEKRGDTPDSVKRARVKEDESKFDKSNCPWDFVVNGNNNIEQVVSDVIKCVDTWEEK